MKKTKVFFLIAAVCAMTIIFVSCKKDKDEDKKVTCTCYDDDGYTYANLNAADYGASDCDGLASALERRDPYANYNCW